MADIYTELHGYLRGQAAVASAVGSGTAARIFPDVPKQNAALPFIVLVESGGGDSIEHLSGLAGFAQATFHVYAYDSSRAAANSLAEVVRLAGPFQTFAGAMGTRRVQVNGVQHRDSGVDTPTDQNDQLRYWTRKTYLLWYDEPTS